MWSSLDWVIDTRRHLTGEDLDDYAIGCMTQMDSVGRHWKRVRIYSEEDLEAAQGLSDDYLVSGRVVWVFVPAAERN